MKNKSRKIISVILICFMLTTVLFACKSNDNNDNNNDNNNGGDNSGGDNNSVNSGNPDSGEAEDKYTSKEIADAIIALFSTEELPESGMSYYFSGADENSDNYIDPERIGVWLSKRPAVVEEFDYLEDFALYIPAGQSIFEVSVLKVKKEEQGNIDAVREVLEKRRNLTDYGQLVQYAPEEVPIMESAKVIVVNSYVILLSTTDNAKAENVISDMIGGNGASLSNNTVASEEQIAEEPVVAKKTVSMDEVVDVEPEILFDFNDIPVIEPQAQDVALRRTPIPRVDVKQYSFNTSFIIGGKCEVGAMIRVTGGTEEIYTGSDYGDYLVEVPFSETGSTTLKMTAESPGKAPSDEITFIVKPQKDVDYYDRSGVFGVIIGYNRMTYFDDCLPDYIGDNLIDDKEIAALKTRTEKKINDLRAKNCNAEIIYLLVPNTVRIWPEDMPKRYTYYTEDTLLRQWKEGVTAGGATVLDLTDLMMAHKNDEFKIWHQTDSHWTEYGAYLGYDALMNYIAKKFPDAAPRPRSDFEFYNEEVNFGDIYKTIGLSITDLKETSTFAKFNFEPPIYNDNYKTGHVDLYDGKSVCLVHDRVQFDHTTHTNLTGLNLPSAYILRDSFDGPFHAFCTDRFSTITYKGMWDYSFNSTQIANLNPDYVIYVISERNIKNVLYN